MLRKLSFAAAMALLAGQAFAQEPKKEPVLPTHVTPIQVQPMFFSKPVPMFPKVDGQPSILHIWASWCPPCREEFPGLLRFSKKHPGLIVRALAVNDTMDTAVRFLSLLPCDVREHSVRLSIKEDGEAPDIAPYEIHVFPTTMFVAADGAIVKRIEGTIDWHNRKTREGVQRFLKGQPFEVKVEE